MGFVDYHYAVVIFYYLRDVGRLRWPHCSVRGSRPSTPTPHILLHILRFGLPVTRCHAALTTRIYHAIPTIPPQPPRRTGSSRVRGLV